MCKADPRNGLNGVISTASSSNVVCTWLLGASGQVVRWFVVECWLACFMTIGEQS